LQFVHEKLQKVGLFQRSASNTRFLVIEKLRKNKREREIRDIFNKSTFTRANIRDNYKKEKMKLIDDIVELTTQTAFIALSLD
jgi:hypothetical protein